MVGTDIPVYMEEYDKYYNELRFDIGDYDGTRQPGWILLCYGCKQITDDFTLLKFIQATFVNIAIFTFFKRESKYVFCCITLYALTSYLLINFNILRQSISLGFVLLFVSYYKDKRYILSVLLLFMAYMFHNSAILTLIIPLFGLIRYNKYVIVCFFASFLAILVALIRMDMESSFEALVESGFMGDGMSDMTELYLKSDRLGAREAQMGVVRLFRIFAIVCVVVFYFKKYKDLYFGGLGLSYLLFLVFSFVIPIMFRFGVYFEIPFYVILSSVVMECPLGRHSQIRCLFFIFAFMVYSYFPYKDYSRKYQGASYRYIDQYYPYHSVLNPKVEDEIDRNKVNFFKWL